VSRGQNALVIIALFLVAGSLLPWAPTLRIACAAGAIALVLGLLAVRLRGHAATRRRGTDDALQARIDRIRADRTTRMGRRR